MKNTLIVMLLSTFCAFGQNENLLKVFNDQVDAFNKQDVKRLVENVSEDFKYFYITSNELVLEVEGKEKFEKSMTAYFSSGRKVLSTIEDYTIDGNRISFKEVVSHLNKEGERVYSSALGVYEIKEGKIVRSWYFID